MLNREVPKILGDGELVRQLFVELNREAIGIPGDGVLVNLVGDDEDIVAADTDKVEKEVALGDKEEEGTTVGDGPPEQAAMPPCPRQSARAW